MTRIITTLRSILATLVLLGGVTISIALGTGLDRAPWFPDFVTTWSMLVALAGIMWSVGKCIELAAGHRPWLNDSPVCTRRWIVVTPNKEDPHEQTS